MVGLKQKKYGVLVVLMVYDVILSSDPCDFSIQTDEVNSRER